MHNAASNGHRNARHRAGGWEPLADWYDGWMGKNGSLHHQRLAIPAVMELLSAQPGEKILDIGAGQGVLAPHVIQAGADYTGLDASPSLLRQARKHHRQGRFLLGDARNLQRLAGMQANMFDAAVFLLSIQDMDPLPAVMEAVAWVLRGGGRVVILMLHPCFRVPRQSGWGWQEERKVRFRRIDRYLTPLSVPLKEYPGQGSGVSISFHRPLQHYINTLADCGLLIEQMKEITTYKTSRENTQGLQRVQARAENLANQEIPLFLALRARKACL
ncbi:methyltransferase domain-containing protein [Ktedonosporobacter rubrisoli]|uniref:Methyltransferase domain-containing protein n=2 Tax=Ktedonosporobacter rubrisoli TaxID=2509675 RepID=A0A4P6K6U2_KTERU|nr:methyltransferase domain-containing protein [Ktedonosporobacter rubrisoli]